MTPTTPHPNTVDRPGTLRRLADVISAAQRRTDLAAAQCETASHLSGRLYENSIEIARSIVAAADDEFWPMVRQFAAVHGSKSDAQAFNLWKVPIAAFLRGIQAAQPGNRGAYDFPPVKRDESGRPLDVDGQPLKFVPQLNAQTGSTIGGYWAGEVATVVDDLDEAGKLELMRRQAGQWSSLFAVAADAVRAEAARLKAGSVKSAAATETPVHDLVTIKDVSIFFCAFRNVLSKNGKLAAS